LGKAPKSPVVLNNGETLMSLNENTQINSVTGISDEERQRIIDFLQGAVYCWCKNRKDEWFSLRDLMGGDNYYWQGTPLLTLYTKHEKINDNPVKEAGKDAGWLLKLALNNDKRTFDAKKEALIKHYRWADDNKNT
jgi:hypothetical protein